MCSATDTSSHCRCHEVVAEARLWGEADACSTPSTRPHLSASADAHVVEVFGHRDVELEHVGRLRQLAGHSLGQAQRPTGAGQHDVGALLLGERGHAERQRGVGEDAGDHDVLAVEQTHASDRSQAVASADPWGIGPAVCKAATMRIGILGGTGPADSALAGRLASIGYTVVIGSRSKYRAMEARDGLVAKWPDLESLLSYGDNPAAADCDVVVIATPWDSAATTAQENADGAGGQGRRQHGQRARARRPRVPAAGAAARQCGCTRAGRGAGMPCRCRVPPPAGDRARPSRSADRHRRVDLWRRSRGSGDDQRDRLPRSPAVARSMPASCRTRPQSRRSPLCSCNSTCATRPVSHPS